MHQPHAMLLHLTWQAVDGDVKRLLLVHLCKVLHSRQRNGTAKHSELSLAYAC
jgi:hypothetical protein